MSDRKALVIHPSDDDWALRDRCQPPADPKDMDKKVETPLVERLRDTGQGNTWFRALRLEAADRIEQLEMELADLKHDHERYMNIASESQTELAEALARLEFLKKHASQRTGQDVYGDGGGWVSGFYSPNSNLDFYDAIDAAKKDAS